MKKQLMSIYDRVSGQFSSPLLFDNYKCGIRYFGYLLSQNEQVKHDADDYQLFAVGVFETDTGLITDNTVQFVCSGHDLKITNDVLETEEVESVGDNDEK